MKAAIYTRVSTSDKGQDVNTQLIPLREYCNNNKWEIVEYSDNISAVKKRPQFDLMMENAKARKFDIVVVWKIDRFVRSIEEFVMVLNTLNSHQVRFISTTQGIDTDFKNSANKLMMTIFTGMAEFERELIRERVKAGINRRRLKGLPVGRQRKIVDSEMIFRLYEQGKSIREIAIELKQKKSTIWRRLKNKVRGEIFVLDNIED